MAKYEEDLIQFDVPLLFRDVKLPSFWSDKPASWFALVESRFRTHSITGEQAKFHQLVRALSKESIGRVLDLIEVPPLFTPYSLLKARLLEAHQLTDYQKVDQLLKMESLSARCPSELLAAMLETCLRDQETNIFFTHLFLCMLPAELRIMLGEDDHQDVRNLVSKADKLWALHSQKSSLVAFVDQLEEDSAVIAAVRATRGRGRRSGRGNRSNRGQQSSRGHKPQPGNQSSSQQPYQPLQATGGALAATAMSPSDLARMGSDLCFFHWSWATRHVTACPPVAGRETRCLGTCQRRRLGQLAYITDQLSQRRFLVDTSAAYSILPHHSSGQPTGPLLAGPDGDPLACCRDKPVQLVRDGCHFQWTFLHAAVQCPIIGVNFLRAHQLLVDPFNNRLLDLLSLWFLKADTDKPHPGAPDISTVDKTEGGGARLPSAQSLPHGSSSPSLPHLVSSPPSPLPPPNVPAAVAQLLLEFPDVVNPSKQLPAAVHDVFHHIKAVGPPLASIFCCLEGDKLQAARAEFDQMEKDGIVRRSTSPWASPLHMVPKKDGSWRPCSNFWQLNLVTLPD